MASEFPRHLLEIEGLDRSQIEALLDLAATFKRERAEARGDLPDLLHEKDNIVLMKPRLARDDRRWIGNPFASVVKVVDVDTPRRAATTEWSCNAMPCTCV